MALVSITKCKQCGGFLLSLTKVYSALSLSCGVIVCHVPRSIWRNEFSHRLREYASRRRCHEIDNRWRRVCVAPTWKASTSHVDPSQFVVSVRVTNIVWSPQANHPNAYSTWSSFCRPFPKMGNGNDCEMHGPFHICRGHKIFTLTVMRAADIEYLPAES